MDKQTAQSIYGILELIGQAMEHLQHTENPELRELVQSGRQEVCRALEKELSCSLASRMHIQAVSDMDFVAAAYRIMEAILDPFVPQNAPDRAFLKLLQYIWTHSGTQLLQNMLRNLAAMRKTSQESYTRFVQYFARFPLWGSMEPEKSNFETLERRVKVLKEHSYDFLWLYRRLEDYLSRCTLWAILLNWATLDTEQLRIVKSIFPDYWEPDIFPDNRDDVLVDVGAFTGDSILQYVNFYGAHYRKIYAYEISADSYDTLRKNTAALHDVICRKKGAGREKGTLFIAENADASANSLHKEESGRSAVEVVPLDDDIEEPVTFLKMDIEGAKQDALLGCARIISTQHPKLAICLYHGYEDIWKIPSMIDELYPQYQFYLRHNGGNLIPTEFVLLCKA